jgi:cyclohexa-1,5-dienecarbonyl-CoA hydratase
MPIRDPRLRVERDGRVARIFLDRPPLNVLAIPAIEQLPEAVDRLISEPEPDIIVLTGSGEKGFSAGVDIADHTPNRVEEMLTGFHRIFRSLSAADRISVAAVRGVCLGGGFELATSCDFVICEENARLGLPEIEVGCFPPVAVAAFSERVGAQRTAEWVLTGRPIPVAEAEAAGLVSRVAPAGKLNETVEEFLVPLLSKSSAVLRVTVAALRKGRAEAFAAALERAEKAYLYKLLRTEDIQEGIAAFTEKRKPSWKHR